MQAVSRGLVTIPLSDGSISNDENTVHDGSMPPAYQAQRRDAAGFAPPTATTRLRSTR